MRSLIPLFILILLAAPAASLGAENSYMKPGKEQSVELWEGKILTARFRAGMCYKPDGKAMGVLILTHRNGNEDVYHLYGSVKNNKFDLSHSSGHYFNGELTGPDSMEGHVKLANGMKMSLKGSRKQNVTLKAPDCAPLY